MYTNYQRIIVTNNPAVARSYADTDRVMFMKDALPFEVYSRARDLIENGGHLIKPVIKGTTDYYTTVGVFYSNIFEPTPGNMREIEAACKATRNIDTYKKPLRLGQTIRQVIDLRRNGPEPPRAA